MNLYERLEVNENASQDTINKIYKMQAKRYHPDLQQSDEDKKIAETKMQKINEAYEVLSNEEKRKEYDEQLKMHRHQKEIENMKNLEIEIRNRYSTLQKQREDANNIVQESINEVQQQEYQEPRNIYTEKDYYRDYNKKLAKMRFEMFKKNLMRKISSILILILSAIIIWFFPPTHKILVNAYNDNFLIKAIVDGIIKTIKR